MFLLMQTTHRMVVCHNADVGHLFVPGIKARIPNETGGYRVVSNTQGFRSDFEFVKDRSSRPRILFLGDSFTAGDGCDNAQRFPELIGAALDAEVYNFAVSGTGTDQQLLIYEKFASDVPADLIVACVYVENIERNKVAFRESVDRVSQGRVLVPKPFFTIEDSKLELHHVPVPLERPDVDAVAPEHFQANGTSRLNPLQRFVYRPLQRITNGRRLGAARSVIKQHLPWLMPAALKLSGYQPFSDYESSASAGWRLMEAILKRLISGASPTPVLIVPIPHYYFYHDGLKPLYQPLFERLAAPDRGVHVVDLTRPLSTLPWPDRKRIAFQFDSHFSPFGHEQVAHVLTNFIEKKGLIQHSQDRLPSLTKSPPMTSTPTDEVKNGQSPQSGGHGQASQSVPSLALHKRNGANRTRRVAETYVLGISAFYHDSAAALVKDGKIIAAAEEERFSRVKNDRRFPARAANYCLEEAGIHQEDLAAIVYYDNAPLTFERLLHSIAAVGSDGNDAWGRILPTWLRYKLHIPRLIRKQMAYSGLVLHESHHRSHAASAFYPSPFERAAIITVDGVGEWATGSIGTGQGREIRLLKEMHFPNSLGLLYSAFTQFTGFKVNSGEYKMMGLAPYGEPKYVDQILNNVCDLKEDGSIELNMEYFSFLSQPAMTSDRFAKLFGGPARDPDAWLTQREMDIARSIQVVTEEALLRTARFAHRLTGEKYLCLAGGVALNCVANGRLLREGPFEDIWIQPAAGDAGCALGAALDVYHTYFGKTRSLPANGRTSQGGSLLGPSYSDSEIKAFLETHGYPHRQLEPTARAQEIAKELAAGKVVGHFSSRLEFGPRSLGARAILGDARNEDMQQNLNLKIKYRESFRPFAPSVLAERAGDYFELDRESPFMLIVAPVRQNRRKPFECRGSDLTALVRISRSDVPAITHVDYSARVQTVVREDHPEYYDVIKAFEGLTGCPVIVNTSFNVRGEPIVCTPDDAYRCFMRTEMDYLALGNYILKKTDQPPWPEAKGHIEEDDNLAARDIYETDFMNAVDAAFQADFLPAVNGLPEGSVRVSTAFHQMNTTWTDVLLNQVGSAAFEIPSALDSAEPDPEMMAAAIATYWTPGPATTALRPVLQKLLQAAALFPEPEQHGLEERVTHTMYVMY